MKKRLDILVFEKGLSDSREKAKLLIMEGKVYVNNQKSDKPGTFYNDDVDIKIKGNQLRYVSRGGLKLEKAIKVFNISIKNAVCLDVGASTGGFTDCMLQNGAKKIYAVDVGYGQLDWKLRNDNRVINIERTNIRYMSKSAILDKIDFFTIDVSFISLKIVLPIIKKFLYSKSLGVCLIKPQFEVTKQQIGKHGVVKDKELHIEVIEKIYDSLIINNFNVKGLDYSPIKGPKGNIEYLIYLASTTNINDNIIFDRHNIKNIVENAHINL